MSENQGNRPEDNVPAAPPHPGPVPPQAASQAPAGWTAPAAQNPQSPYARPHQAYGAPQPPYAGRPGAPAAHATQPTTPLTSETPDEPRKKSGAGKVVGLIVAAALVGGAAGLGGGYAGAALWGGESEAAPVAGPDSITINDPDDATLTTAIAAKVVPSVVTISATSGSGGGTGSGVILDEEGHVVTNTHVVTLDGQSADAAITATTSDGRVYEAEIVGVDPIYDLAVIQLQDAEGLTPIEFADSDKLNVGDVAVAVGAPLGLSNTVTTGIISALERSISVASAAVPDDAESEDGGQTPPGQEGPFFFDFGQGQQQTGSNETISIAVIQTDAAINPGNSGGALVDSEGRLIGINVAIASAGGSSGQAGNIGVGFAIPSDIAERVADEIIETGSATHGLLGATVQPASAVGGTDIAGAYIAEVTPGGAADEAGLREGDIVTAVDGKPITTSIDLTAQVRALAAGADATLTYVRDGETRTADVTLGELGA
ncbi:PDZ domain-containing protein [Microbacterium lushaniae]|nr:PDZ domain-containing protein [Microbacterium lushaniae]KAA9158804.1 PDZ domain-containing protein [Microbacterium lushaniae]